jgi:hypothetical protein
MALNCSHGKINLSWFGEDVHFLLTKLAMIQDYKFSISVQTMHSALFEALYSTSQNGHHDM